MSQNILIIGGNRFFGRHLTSQLLQEGHRPVLFNRQSLDDGFGSKVERIKGDRNQHDGLREVAVSRKWDFVFDQVCFTAAQARLALALFENQVGRYVVTSSQSVYDYGINLKETAFDPFHYQFTTEVDQALDYAEAKRQMEATFYQKAKFPVIAVRFPVVLGTDDYTKRLHWHFARLKAKQGVYFPDLKARMGFIRSDEAGRILRELTRKDWSRPLNVASSEPIAMKALLEMIEKEMGYLFKIDKKEEGGNTSPFGIKGDWFMNMDQLQKLGLSVSPLMSWLPGLIAVEAKTV